ncbi:threonine--tRNA ligase [Chloropicon primus]|uniref:Probable threonine--tRNA ligase, cytoplasmic n=1 Tax=Chloropicon primus TaxID=1764295 RepID=A0A5B8MK26_9CHLO|nr:threonine--tRNA ligase [Chloropicon primus]UPQ99643.1 threonine--tRNA ligase [Chloropicon primus]|mmetsp:Transcript_4469/g.13227  ORF Transcript_4469/g.13227 Transcript_4469/m.13227 type:complete len:738 (+) Transcript_4469:104-2317(+)|eukprot:QDZ20434.1 threonine--tRNA ligase [Chloropicon primus]
MSSGWWDEREGKADAAALVKAGKENAKNQIATSSSAGGKQRGKGWGSASVPTQPADPNVKKPYYEKRIKLFEKYFERTEFDAKQAAEENVPIKITLPDGNTRDGVRYVTTPKDVASGISKRLGKEAVVAKVNGENWDIFRPLEGDCKLQIFTFDSPEGKYTYWHSTAHVLGEALELEYGADLTIGPPIEEGFYYDCFMGDKTLHDEDREKLTKRIDGIIKEKQVFQRAVVTREEALHMFQENPFKVEVIEGLAEGSTITLYRNGPFCDLCRGPHVPDTGLIKSFQVNQMSRAHWRGDVENAPLNRVYGVSFPDKKLLKKYIHRIEEAKKRDHRVIGTKQDLFFFHTVSPGSCFFQPYGTRVYNKLLDFVKEKYWAYGYDEVTSPNIFHFDLWNTSGHAGHYKQNMFHFHVEKEEWGMKPMNCPGHCVLYSHRNHSFRELPLRYAEFGVLHRNEYSGALSGLTRVRRFVQDDAHIFCRKDQIGGEIKAYLNMFKEIYDTLGLDYDLALSTRPEGFLGDIKDWDEAETALTTCLNDWKANEGKRWTLNPEDGAFYGPKIDITVYDALGRSFQCATVQLDFQLPIRFGLKYMNSEGEKEPPVIIHRAIMGSFERMIAILTEHFAGKWPLWMSPKQIMVVPISSATNDYALQVKQSFHQAKFFVEADVRDLTMQKKVRDAQLNQFNYILVVGAQEQEHGTVNVRTRNNKVCGEKSISEVLELLSKEREEKMLEGIMGQAKK